MLYSMITKYIQYGRVMLLRYVKILSPCVAFHNARDVWMSSYMQNPHLRLVTF